MPCSIADANQKITQLTTKKIPCAVARVFDILGEVSAIVRTMRIGMSRPTSKLAMTNMIHSFSTLALPTEDEAILTIDCPMITADTIDHSGMKKILRN